MRVQRLGGVTVALALVAGLALAETDYIALPIIQDIQLGRKTPNAIQNLLVTKSVTLPTNSVNAVGLKAGTALPAVNGASITNVPATALQAGTSLPALNGAALTNLAATLFVGKTLTFRTLTNVVINGVTSTVSVVEWQ